ncbi:MAG: DUF2927 domain-containing protein [Afipia sp.]|jgi:hypothetical protein|nr:DUF2927 domain-containing protein [Afipia sp.]
MEARRAEACPAIRRLAPRLVAVLGGFALAVLPPAPPAGADPLRSGAHARAERKTFTDGEIIDGFMKTAFGAEYHLAGRVDRIRKYHAPVRIFIDGATRADRRNQLGRVVGDIAAKVRNLDIAMAGARESANAVITLVRDRDLQKTIATFYGSDRARDIHQALDPQCLSGFRKNENFEIQRSDVILTVDNGDFVFLDCAYEELLQSLGPINDTDAVPWTMFNDQVSMGFFDIYDQYIMNILYDPRIRAGMTVDEVRAVLPAVLPDVRAWVAKVNNLPQ